MATGILPLRRINCGIMKTTLSVLVIFLVAAPLPWVHALPLREEKPPEHIWVLVAKKDIYPGNAIRNPDELFELVCYTFGDVPADAVRDFWSLRDKLVATRIPKGQPLRRGDLAEMVVFALPQHVAKGAWWSAGARVAVILIRTQPDKTTKVDKLLTDLEVIQVVDVWSEGSPWDEIHWLAVTVKQAEQLEDAQKLGKLRLMIVESKD